MTRPARPKIRAAKATDIPVLVRLCAQAQAASDYAGLEVQETLLKRNLLNLIQRQGMKSFPCLVAVADNEATIEGVIIAISSPVYQVLGATGVTDMLWYAAPGAHGATGVRLARAMHRWAAKLPRPVIVEQRTSDAITDPAKIGQVLKRLGMQETGRVYRKEFRS